MTCKPTNLLKVRSADEYAESHSSFSSSRSNHSSFHNIVNGKNQSSQNFDGQCKIIIDSIDQQEFIQHENYIKQFKNCHQKLKGSQVQIHDTYTPQKVNDNSLRKFQGSFSTKREKMEIQQQEFQIIKIKADLFGAPSKENFCKQLEDNLKEAQNQHHSKPIIHKISFHNKRKDNYTYTIPKLPSRILTYDDQNLDQNQQENDSNNFLIKKINSQKIRKSTNFINQDFLQVPLQYEELNFDEDKFIDNISLNNKMSQKSKKKNSSPSLQLQQIQKNQQNQYIEAILMEQQSTQSDSEIRKFEEKIQEKRKNERLNGNSRLTVLFRNLETMESQEN